MTRFLVISMLLFNLTFSNTYYVDPVGSNTYPFNSQQTAALNIRMIFDSLSLQEGDTIECSGDIYENYSVTIDIPVIIKSQSNAKIRMANNITGLNYTCGGSPEIQNIYFYKDSSAINSFILFQSGEYVSPKIRGSTFAVINSSESLEYGTYINTAISIAGGNVTFSDFLIENNKFCGLYTEIESFNPGSAIGLTSNILIRNNIIMGHTPYGTSFNFTYLGEGIAQNIDLINNTVVHPMCLTSVVVACQVANSKIINNVFYCVGNGILAIGNGYADTTNVVDANITYGYMTSYEEPLVPGDAGIESEPLLLSSNVPFPINSSPCLNSGFGSSVYAEVPGLDIIGTSRSIVTSVDIGAYEVPQEGDVPVISSNPVDQINISEYSGYYFSVVAEGTLPMAYQWQYYLDGIWIDLEWLTGLTVVGVANKGWAPDWGGYWRCKVTNYFGSVISNTANLTLE